MSNDPLALPKVLYIMGTARSGSTILEIILSEGSDVFGAGELTNLIQDGFIENKPCSCGASCTDCDIWGKVCEYLKLDRQGFEEWAELQKRMDWYDGIFKQIFHVMPRKDILRYRELNARLLIATQKVTGCNIVLDSSKYAGRALALLRVVHADVKVICLTRLPAGLMQSFQKPNKDEQHPKSPLGACLYYLIALLSLRLASFKIRPLYISYEELLASPEAVIREIESYADINLSNTISKINNDESFSVGHLVTANRLRKLGTIRFSPQQGEQNHLQPLAKVMTSVMNIWKVLLRF